MNWTLILSLLLVGVLAVSLWIAYCDARAQFAPLKPVSWRYHWRVRWWLTPSMKNDLFLFALAAGWVAWEVWT